MSTSASAGNSASMSARRSRIAAGGIRVAEAAAAAGGLALVGEAAVHVQQFVEELNGVSWIGPLFILNAVACVVLAAGLVFRRTRVVAALGGIVVSVLALGGLVISYGTGLFGWQEAGWRTGVELAVIAEVAAVLLLAVALAARMASPPGR